MSDMCVRVIVDIFLVRFLFFFASFFLRVDVPTKNKEIQEANIMSTTRDQRIDGGGTEASATFFVEIQP